MLAKIYVYTTLIISHSLQSVSADNVHSFLRISHKRMYFATTCLTHIMLSSTAPVFLKLLLSNVCQIFVSASERRFSFQVHNIHVVMLIYHNGKLHRRNKLITRETKRSILLIQEQIQKLLLFMHGRANANKIDLRRQPVAFCVHRGRICFRRNELLCSTVTLQSKNSRIT